MTPEFRIGGEPLLPGNLHSRSITAENPGGKPGAGGKALGGRKGAPCLPNLARDQRFTFARIDGPGAIRHLWMTVAEPTPWKLRNLILRFYWDGAEHPSVEVPLGDFFGGMHGRLRHFDSLFLTVPEGRGMNAFFLMPFGKSARLEIHNDSGADAGMFFYQVDYTLGDSVDETTPRFHSRFNRCLNTRLAEDYTVLDRIEGKGRFLGAVLGMVDRFQDKAWWGEGELKWFIDGDADHPTLCGTGTEDYVGSAWGLGQFHTQRMGAPLISEKYKTIYRFHDVDPIYFRESLRLTWQQIGNDGKEGPASPDGPFGPFIEKGEYRKDRPGGNHERVDDVASVAFWYQTPVVPAGGDFPDRHKRSHDI